MLGMSSRSKLSLTPPDNLGDPFEGLLERSSVAQALREARASLHRPSRPFTAESRSLFEKADSACGTTRPSSSYSLDQISFERDTFASSRGSFGSTRTGSGRSTRSRESKTPSTNDLCAVPELEEPFLELPLELRQNAEVMILGEDAEEATSPSGECALEFDVEDPGFEPEEEYDAGEAAHDLAMRMDMPPPCSDEESGMEETGRQADKSASPAKKKRSPAVRAEEQLRRKSSSTKLSRTSLEQALRGSKLQGEPSALQVATEELEAFGREGKGEALEVAQITKVTERICALATDFHAGGLVDKEGQARLFRAVLALMDRKAEPIVVVRLAKCALELLRIGAMVQHVGHQGVGAAYLNVARALFKLSKDSALDADYEKEGLLAPLLELLGQSLPCGETSTELKIFVAGILKNASNNSENQKVLAKGGALDVLIGLMNPTGRQFLGGPQEAQLLIQVTALLRNLASTPKRQLCLIELGAFSALARASSKHAKHAELQVNIARVIGKLSQHDAACQALEDDLAPLQQMAASLREHSASPALVLRLAFALGNITGTSDKLRVSFMSECDGVVLLASLLERYWQQDRKLARASSDCSIPMAIDDPSGASLAPTSTDPSECESVLVKLARLVANIAINSSVGMQLAAQPSIIDPLLNILGCKRMPESEELVLSATASVTNLLYHDSPSNILFTPDNKQLMCRLLRPMLLESYNVEALVEAARALGNLSRHRDARQWISELRIDEAMAILLAHSDRDLVFYSCGALVNMAADPSTGRRLCHDGGLATKLSALLRDAPASDLELLLVAVKVLSNLRIKDDGEEPWPKESLHDIQAGLQRAFGIAADAASEEDTQNVSAAGSQKPKEVLKELSQQLLGMLSCEEN